MFAEPTAFVRWQRRVDDADEPVQQEGERERRLGAKLFNEARGDWGGKFGKERSGEGGE